MKLKAHSNITGYSLGEMMVVLSITTIIMGAAITASVSLQKSLSAADKFFATHMQQIRIIDYLSRDVKRSTAVTTSIKRSPGSTFRTNTESRIILKTCAKLR